MSGTSTRGAAAGPEGGPDRPFTVSRLNGVARRLLESGLGETWIEAEVAGFRAWSSGHWYLTLKDETASVAAVMFKSANRSCRVRPEDGVKVLVRGRVSLYEQRGTYQVVLDHLELAGEGALWRAFERLKRRLEGEGLFDPSRKRELPRLPRRVGVATSREGAALRDVLEVLRSRGARVHVLVAHCRVQGQDAPEEIVRALRLLDRHGGLDVVIACRGGGSMEDLWAFNDEGVARAIAAMGVPVVSAVGHETDTTIADLVADVRAATPSQAAELVSASEAEVRARVADQLGRLRQALRATLGETRARLAAVRPERLAERLVRSVALAAQRLGHLRGSLGRGARAVGQRSSQHLDHLEVRLSRAGAADLAGRRRHVAHLRRRLSPVQQLTTLKARRGELAGRCDRLEPAALRFIHAARERVEGLARALAALSPLAVLERGYAVVQSVDGRVVRDAGAVEPGQRLTARLARGRLQLEVERRLLDDDGSEVHGS